MSRIWLDPRLSVPPVQRPVLDRTVGARLTWIAVWVLAALCGLVVIREASLVVLNSDLVQNYLEASDVLKGNVLLKGWHLASDNFYLSDTPLFVISRLLFGGGAAAIYAPAAFTYLAIIVSALLIVREVSADSKAALTGFAAVAIFIATPGLAALGQQVLTSAVHAGVVALSLAAWYAMLIVLRRPERRAVLSLAYLAFGLAALVMAVSDPLSLVVFFAPTLALLIHAGVVQRRWRAVAGPMAVALAAVILAKIGVHAIAASGGFVMEPTFGLKFVSADELSKTLQGIVFGAMRITDGYVFDRELADPKTLIALVRAAALLLPVLAVVSALRRAWVGTETADASLVLALAVLANIASCLFSNAFADAVGPDPQHAFDGGGAIRYLVPAVLFGGVLTAVELPRMLAGLKNRRLAELFRVLVLAGAAAVTVVFLIDGLGYFRQTPWVLASSDRARADWLQRHGLVRGVGSYWEASILSTVSRERVLVRPVTGVGGTLQPRLWLSSEHWYDAKTPPQFVIFATKNDSAVNAATVRASYGEPRCVRTVAGAVIEVLDPQHGCEDLSPAEREEALTGQMSNADFLNWLYQHELGRPPDSGGFAYWSQQLDHGLSREQLREVFARAGE